MTHAPRTEGHHVHFQMRQCISNILLNTAVTLPSGFTTPSLSIIHSQLLHKVQENAGDISTCEIQQSREH